MIIPLTKKHLVNPIGGDLREGKVTLPAILLLQRDNGRARELIHTTVREQKISSDDWEELLSLLRQHRAIEDAYDRAVEYASNAKRLLDVFPASAEREALRMLPDYVLARDR